jgi:putative phage-type endonuclease
MEAGRAQWLDERRKGIGGTDAAAILGFSPYETEHDVWLAKMDMAPEKRDTEPMWWGRELEAIIARRYTERTGNALLDPQHEDGRKRLVYHPDFPHLIGSPDRLVIGKERGLEIKTASPWMSEEWGEEGSDSIPRHHLIQCAHYMAITGFRRWDVAVLIGGSDFRVYHLCADPDIEQAMVERLNNWWAMRIIDRIPPPIDGSPAAKRYLSSKFPKHMTPRMKATARMEELASSLGEATVKRVAAEEQVTYFQNLLKESIGEAEGADGEGWRVTWKQSKNRTYTDWEQVAQTLRAAMEKVATGHGDAAFSAAVDIHTETSEGIRPFRFTVSSKEEAHA